MDITDSLLIIAHIALAMLLGGVVGFERELKLRPAGFRTHMLVAGASALIVGVGQLVMRSAEYAGPQGAGSDPLRLAEAIISGVAFIGAGTIFGQRHASDIGGITTAASLLTVAAVGLAVGFGYYVVAVGMVVLTLVVLTVAQRLERRIQRQAKAQGKPSEERDGGTISQ